MGLFIFIFVSSTSYSQNKWQQFLTPSDTLNKPRQTSVLVGEAVVFSTALVGLHQLWYKDYPQSKFHTINDNNQWLQLDKIGHFYSAYHIGRFSSELLQWSGASKKEQLYYGATSGLAFLTAVEIFDGFSKEWGFSWGDIIANTSGTTLYIAQELLWSEQRIIPKFSFHTTKYAKARPATLGASINEQVLKDYNGQTYWLSANLDTFIKQNKLPKWLNIAVGYSGSNMFYGSYSEAQQNGYYQKPNREFFISLDIDLTKIKTESALLKTVFSVCNTIKIPAPTLQLSNGKLRGYIVYF